MVESSDGREEKEQRRRGENIEGREARDVLKVPGEKRKEEEEEKEQEGREESGEGETWRKIEGKKTRRIDKEEIRQRE